jgi:hypothetical protein
MLQSLADKRRQEEEDCLQKMLRDIGVIENKESVQEIYSTLKGFGNTDGNPLTNMMSRNLRVFAKNDA